MKTTLLTVNQTKASSIEARNYVNALIEDISLLADNTICQQLRILNDVLPCFPESLEANAVKGIHVNRQSRFIETPDDLLRLQGFLDNLHNRLM